MCGVCCAAGTMASNAAAIVDAQQQFRRHMNRANAVQVEQLLRGAQGHLIDPAEKDNKPLRLAAANGWTSMVEVLMRDGRVDPSARNQEALRVSVFGEYWSLMAALLHDRRVALDLAFTMLLSQRTTIDFGANFARALAAMVQDDAVLTRPDFCPDDTSIEVCLHHCCNILIQLLQQQQPQKPLLIQTVRRVVQRLMRDDRVNVNYVFYHQPPSDGDVPPPSIYDSIAPQHIVTLLQVPLHRFLGTKILIPIPPTAAGENQCCCAVQAYGRRLARILRRLSDRGGLHRDAALCMIGDAMGGAALRKWLWQHKNTF